MIVSLQSDAMGLDLGFEDLLADLDFLGVLDFGDEHADAVVFKF